MHRNKMLHFGVEINQALIESLVDIGVSMSVMEASVVRKFRIMHLVIGNETYKIASEMVTQAFGKIINLLVRVGGIICQMVFLVVNTYNYKFVIVFKFSYENIISC